MLRKEVPTERPQRWDAPFDHALTELDVDHLLSLAPFRKIDANRFPRSCPLRGILKNDVRVRTFREGDLVVREGDYGTSAFLILSGELRVTLEPLAAELLGRRPNQSRSFWSRLAKLIVRSRYREVRRTFRPAHTKLGQRNRGQETQVFLQDIPAVLQSTRTAILTSGEIFGELAALSRAPRSATVFANRESRLLEIRWQGLRDLMRFDPSLRKHINDLYRKNSLAAHLRGTPLFQRLDPAHLDTFVKQTEFESFGRFEWNQSEHSHGTRMGHEQIEDEPLVACEGSFPTNLVLIRNGFARVSRRRGTGHVTHSYLGKGHVFGLEELYAQWKSQTPVKLTRSLRAVGYMDVLRVPASLLEQHVFPYFDDTQQNRLLRQLDELQGTEPVQNSPGRGSISRSRTLETDLLEFIVDQRLMNGSQTMVVNLDRCTRCDDCVQACADTHDGNTRFVRQGPTFDKFLFASACMHCEDPVCMIGCPTGAISRNRDSTTVLIHDESCIGCQTCAQRCPYSAIRMVNIRDPQGHLIVDQATMVPLEKATKCDLCHDGFGGPACQRACPHDALIRIDLRQPEDLARWLNR